MRALLLLAALYPSLAWGSIQISGPSLEKARVGQSSVTLSCELTNTHERVQKCSFLGPNKEAFTVEGNKVVDAAGKVAKGLTVGKGTAGRSCSLEIDVLDLSHFGKPMFHYFVAFTYLPIDSFKKCAVFFY